MKKRRRSEAELFLEPYGFVWGTHFNTELEARTLAGTVKLELSRQEKMRAAEEGFIKLEDRDSCLAKCRGWDGESETCDCLGYRTSWELSGSWKHGEAAVHQVARR